MWEVNRESLLSGQKHARENDRLPVLDKLILFLKSGWKGYGELVASDVDRCALEEW